MSVSKFSPSSALRGSPSYRNEACFKTKECTFVELTNLKIHTNN
jgi:hypothetical protein